VASSTSVPIDTTTWIAYTSRRYGFTLKHPAGWIARPAKHDWTLKADAKYLDSGAQDGFLAPDGDLYVAVWATPARDTPQTLEGVGAWVEQYCQHAGSPCPGVKDQAVPLCNERWDCHPGLLVPFAGREFRAFFTGGDFGGQMVGVDVGRPDWHESLAKWGGARRLLEAFLSTMDVCPARPGQMPPGCP
jgi:hypothetical protein